MQPVDRTNAGSHRTALYRNTESPDEYALVTYDEQNKTTRVVILDPLSDPIPALVAIIGVTRLGFQILTNVPK